VPAISGSSQATSDTRVGELIRPTLEASGYELVRVTLGGRGRRTLQVMVERGDRGTMTVDDCAEVSRTLSDVLDREDPIAGAFDLEVSSPGLDRPLTRLDDYRRFAGLDAQVELDEAVDGRRRFTGRLDGVEEGEPAAVLIATTAGVARLPWPRVRKGKLVLNDKLLAAARRWTETGRSP
jgi:ribosome maturation factor RimP